MFGFCWPKNVALKIILLHQCSTFVWKGSVTLGEEYWLRVFQKMALRKVFGPKRNELTGSWRRLHNEEFHDFIKHQSLFEWWVGHVAYMGDERNINRSWMQEWNLKKSDHMEDLYVVMMIIFKLSSNKRDKELVLDWSGSGYGVMGRL